MAHILVVEDEQSLAEAYKTILKAHGHVVQTAADGQIALELVGKKRPDIILLDMKLPKMSGLEFLRQLHGQTHGNLQTSVIIFSNQEDQSEIDEAYSLGAKRYILKAWASPQHLAKIVSQVLAASDDTP